jgi:CubicO group peptidase (beta-lactamase class C family)
MVRRAARSLLFPLLMAMLTLPAFSAEPSPLAGHWEGAISLPGTPLQIFLDFSAKADAALVGTISIPAQNAKDLPLVGIEVNPPGAIFEIEGPGGKPTFQGFLSIDGATLEGTFTQGGQGFPFKLQRRQPGEEIQSALAGLDTVIAGALKQFEVPGLAIAVVKDKEIIYAKGFGQRDVEKNLPVTPDTLFAIGSCTKAFTALLLGTLVDEGKLDWDKPLRTTMPEFRLKDTSASERITGRDLLCHRSGLPRHDLVWYNNQELARKDLVARLAYLEPTADLRAKWQYNNLMFLTAGYLAERLTGKSWEQDIRERILDPLGMRRTNFDVAQSQKDPDHAEPYEKRDEKVVKVPFRPIGNMGPAGSINSSVNEMARWLILQLSTGKVGDHKFVEATTLNETHLAQMVMGEDSVIPEVTPGSYALGWMVDTYRGRPRISHGGGIDGFVSEVEFYPMDGVGIVVLTNSSSAGLASIIARTAADRALKLEPKDWVAEAAAKKAVAESMGKEAKKKAQTVRKAGTHPAHALAEYAGDYENLGYGTLTFNLKDGKFWVMYNGIATPLEHWHYETFNGLKADDPAFEDAKYTFQTDVKGHVAVVSVPMELAVKEIVFERKPDARFLNPATLKPFAGSYQLGPETVTVTLQGSGLTVYVPGQPVYDLVPGLAGEFALKQVPAITLKFQEDGKGAVTGMEFYQPNGVFSAKRK